MLESHRQRALLVAALAVPCAIALLFPGDAPWINDEPQFIALALQANSAGRLATHALVGSQGVAYGPFAIWVYQLLLLFTHDPIVLVVAHAVLLSAGTAVGLGWLARELRLWPWFAPIVAASPYLWFYSRLLWDNSFNIPLSALAMAAYAAFLARGSRTTLAITLCCLAAEPLVHPMSLAFVIPIALHLVWFRGQSLWRHRWVVVGVLAVTAVAYHGYAAVLAAQLRGGALRTGSHGLAPNGFFFPLLGARLISAVGLGYFFGQDWGDGLLVVARTASAVAFPLAWVGIVIAVRRVLAARRTARPTTLDHVAGLSLGILVAQMLLDGVARVWIHPHYFNATWIAFVVLAWLSADAASRAGRLRWIVWLHGGSLAVSTLWLIGAMHVRSGTRGIHYGPTLRNQMQVADDIERHSPESRIVTDVAHYARFPHALAVLRSLQPPRESTPLPPRELVIRYVSSDPHDGRLEVVPR